MLRKFSHIIFPIILIFYSFNVFAQIGFKIQNSKKKETISFKLISNLIIFPIEVNGKDLNFILDSGVGSTVLFNLNPLDSIELKNEVKIKLQGLGSQEPVDAILSKNNHFKIKGIGSITEKLYVISNDNFDLSSKMGLTIHGIIGYEILKDFVIRINYSTKKITFYRPNEFVFKKSNNYESFDLQFYKFKPYIDVGVKLNKSSNKLTPVKLLIDSGGSDALWLFENSHSDIKTPSNYFNDFLGEGLSGSVYGKRAKIKSLHIGNFELLNPTVSYPDSISVSHALKFKDRNGSMGASVLKRFVVIFDYKQAKLYLKKGGGFKSPFKYNMSGIELAYNGKVLVKEKDEGAIEYLDPTRSSGTKITLDYSYKFVFKPTYRIQKLQVGSPAYEAGLKEGDIVIKINGDYTYNLKLEEIVAHFYEKENKKIQLVVERNGKHYKYNFRLRDMLN